MQKTIKVRENLTFGEFGCEANHFEKYIKGKQLRVVAEYQDIVLVLDSQDEQHTIYKTDIANEKEVTND